MRTKEEILKDITRLQKSLESLHKELRAACDEVEKGISKRLNLAEQGKGDFKPDELRFAAFSRCPCGAGMAYPKEIGVNGHWYCSDILMGKALPKGQIGAKSHEAPLPFAFYEIKSEDQSSANGATTRPNEKL